MSHYAINAATAISPQTHNRKPARRGGATVLKVGGQILQAKQAETF